MPSRISLVTASMLFGCAALTAQTTRTVGPTGTYATIQQAVAAAADGDVILVQPGGYNVSPGIVTDKALRVVGGPGTQLLGPTNASLWKVTGLAAGKVFALEGFQIFSTSSTFATYPLELTNNQGVIHLTGLEVTGLCPGGGFSCEEGMMIQNCSRVVMTRCTVRWLTVNCYSSAVEMSQCDIKGRKAKDPPSGYGTAGTSGVLVVSSSVRISQSVIRGGDGDQISPGQSAAGLVFSTSVVAGDSQSQFEAGQPGTISSLAPAVEMAGGSLSLDPDVQLLPNPGALTIKPIGTGAGTVSSARPAALLVDGGAIGGPLQFDVRAEPGELVALYAGPAAGSPLATPFGPVWLEPAHAFLLALDFQFAGTWLVLTSSVPNDPSLIGNVFGFVAIVGGGALPWRLSNQPAIVTH